MKVGIAIPAFNCRKYIEMCLTTLNAQTYPVSIYIVDDASNDGLYEFLTNRPSWYTKLDQNTERCGWPYTLNKAAQLAIHDGCDAIFTMNADDFLRIDCIEKCVAALQDHDWCVVYAQQVGGENVVQISSEGATLDDFRDYPPLVNYALIPSHIWNEVGGYPTDASLPNSWGYKEDYAFWIKIFKAGHINYAVIKEPVYYYVMHPNQLHEEGLNNDRMAEARRLIMEKYGW